MSYDQPGPTPPIDPRGAQTPPPAPPMGAPPAYAYGYPPAAPEKKSAFAGITKIGGVLSMAVFLFLLGFYAAVFAMNSNSGPQQLTYQAGKGKDKVAIIPIEGMIMGGSADFVRKVVDQVIKDETVKAVVLRVDSPGGAVTPSDEIFRHIQRLKNERDIPIVASFGGVAASGGYYVSCGADFIYVQPTTLTGSIGVLSQIFTMEKLFQEKLGINAQMITSTKSTEKHIANDTFRKWDEADMKKLKQILDVMHEQFVDVVYEGRAKHAKDRFPDRDSVYTVATGRTYTAKDSIEAGLCDEIGYIDAAIDKAKQLGGLTSSDAPVVIYRSPGGLGDLFGVTATPVGSGNGSSGVSIGSGSASGGSMQFDVSIDASAVRRMLGELSMPHPAYLMSP